MRELRNLIERSLILGALNVLRSTRAWRAHGAGARATTASDGRADGCTTLEKQHILAVLESVGGDKTRAAQLLGVSRRTPSSNAAPEWGPGRGKPGARASA